MLYTDQDQRQATPASKQNKPIRVLHVVQDMKAGGAETWLMRVMRQIDRNRFHFDFLVTTQRSGTYDDEIRQLGGRLIPCLHPSRPWLYGPAFKRAVRQYGPYDVVHAHLHHFNGYVLRLAKQVGVPVRIAHSHIDSSYQEANAGVIRRYYLSLMKSWINRYSTVGLGCSREASIDLFGPAWNTDPRYQVFYYSIDLSPFQNSVDRAAIRAELGLPEKSFVLGHVGRFAEQKNHRFLVDIFAEVAQQLPEAYLLLVGDGFLKPEIESLVNQTGLTNRVIFTGARSDIPRLMLGAMDLFIMPSLFEGLPVTLIEAQAANLPLLIADCISEEADIIKPLVQRVGLAQPTSVWADAVNHIYSSSRSLDQSLLLENSSFNIARSINSLEKIYAT